MAQIKPDALGYIVQRDNGIGYRRFYDNQEREARDYYNSLQALDNQEKMIKQQEQQFRLQQENAKRNASNTYSRSVPTPTPRPTSQPYYDPEYAEFQKWKMENDPQYIKFKQEKERKARIEREEAERKAKAKQEREEREREAAERKDREKRAEERRVQEELAAADKKDQVVAEIKAQKVGGVPINGVIWATRNVGAKGTFVNNPQDYGNDYTWEEVKNACPRGWRLPTKDEFEKLLRAPNNWTTNGVIGRTFGSGNNTVFLPAAGYRYSDGTLGGVGGVGSFGYYWSSTQYNEADACSLGFSSGSVSTSSDNRRYGFSVRCVAE